MDENFGMPVVEAPVDAAPAVVEPAPVVADPAPVEPAPVAVDSVNSPAHYTAGQIEVIDFIDQVTKAYPPELAHYIGCLIKYAARAPLKGNLKQDLEKGAWYLNRAVSKLA